MSFVAIEKQGFPDKFTVENIRSVGFPVQRRAHPPQRGSLRTRIWRSGTHSKVPSVLLYAPARDGNQKKRALDVRIE